MIVRPEHVEAGLDVIRDVERCVRVKYEARKAERRMLRAEARAFLSYNDGAIKEKEMRARLDPQVVSLQDELDEVLQEVDRWRADEHAADTTIELYRTESANTRKGVL